MLVRLLYVSREINNEIANLAETSLDRFRESNTQNDITGVLCEGEGLFLQVLEGERSNVNKLYASILRDTRHKDIELLYFEEIKERFFDAWTMEYIQPRSKPKCNNFLKEIVHANNLSTSPA